MEGVCRGKCVNIKYTGRISLCSVTLIKNMKAIEFQATVQQHLLRVPDSIPDGVSLRVLLLVEDEVVGTEKIKRRKPSPKLAGTVTMQDDLIQPAVPPDDWNSLL